MGAGNTAVAAGKLEGSSPASSRTAVVGAQGSTVDRSSHTAMSKGNNLARKQVVADSTSFVTSTRHKDQVLPASLGWQSLPLASALAFLCQPPR